MNQKLNRPVICRVRWSRAGWGGRKRETNNEEGLHMKLLRRDIGRDLIEIRYRYGKKGSKF